MWIKTHHCAWDFEDMRIVQEFCKRRGGIVFKLFDGQAVHYFKSLVDAQAFAEDQRKFA
jgi:hypothetical protein